MIRNQLPQLLARKGISIRQLARDTGITYSTIWGMVHSQRRSVQLEVLDAVCSALQVQPGDIYRAVQAGAERPPAQEQEQDRPSPRQEVPSPGQETARAGRQDTGGDWRAW